MADPLDAVVQPTGAAPTADPLDAVTVPQGPEQTPFQKLTTSKMQAALNEGARIVGDENDSYHHGQKVGAEYEQALKTQFPGIGDEERGKIVEDFKDDYRKNASSQLLAQHVNQAKQYKESGFTPGLGARGDLHSLLNIAPFGFVGKKVIEADVGNAAEKLGTGQATADTYRKVADVLAEQDYRAEHTPGAAQTIWETVRGVPAAFAEVQAMQRFLPAGAGPGATLSQRAVSHLARAAAWTALRPDELVAGTMAGTASKVSRDAQSGQLKVTPGDDIATAAGKAAFNSASSKLLWEASGVMGGGTGMKAWGAKFAGLTIAQQLEAGLQHYTTGEGAGDVVTEYANAKTDDERNNVLLKHGTQVLMAAGLSGLTSIPGKAAVPGEAPAAEPAKPGEPPPGPGAEPRGPGAEPRGAAGEAGPEPAKPPPKPPPFDAEHPLVDAAGKYYAWLRKQGYTHAEASKWINTVAADMDPKNPNNAFASSKFMRDRVASDTNLRDGPERDFAHEMAKLYPEKTAAPPPGPEEAPEPPQAAPKPPPGPEEVPWVLRGKAVTPEPAKGEYGRMLDVKAAAEAAGENPAEVENHYLTLKAQQSPEQANRWLDQQEARLRSLAPKTSPEAPKAPEAQPTAQPEIAPQEAKAAEESSGNPAFDAVMKKKASGMRLTPEDFTSVMQGANLSPLEEHIVRERLLNNRTHDDIKDDNEASKRNGDSYARERIQQIEVKALRKMGAKEGTIKSLVHDSDALDRQIDMLEKGRRVPLSELSNQDPDRVVKRIGSRQNVLDRIDARMTKLANELMKGTTPERKKEITDEFTRLDQHRKGADQTAEGEPQPSSGALSEPRGQTPVRPVASGTVPEGTPPVAAVLAEPGTAGGAENSGSAGGQAAAAQRGAADHSQLGAAPAPGNVLAVAQRMRAVIEGETKNLNLAPGEVASGGYCVFAAEALREVYPGTKLLMGKYNGVRHTVAKMGDHFVDITGDQFGRPAVQVLSELPKEYEGFKELPQRNPSAYSKELARKFQGSAGVDPAKEAPDEVTQVRNAIAEAARSSGLSRAVADATSEAGVEQANAEAHGIALAQHAKEQPPATTAAGVRNAGPGSVVLYSGLPVPELAKLVGQGVSALGNAFRVMFSPASVSQFSSATAGNIRQHLAELQNRDDAAQHALYAAKAWMDRNIVAVKDDAARQANFLAFTEPYEKGQAANLPPQLQEFAASIKKLKDEVTQELLSRGLLNSFIENHLGHLWKDPNNPNATPEEMAARMAAKRPLSGGEGFRKQRTMPTWKDGIDAGLVPATWNPVEAELSRLHEMYKSIFGRDVFNDEKDGGRAVYVPLGQRAPAGMVPIPDKFATQYARLGDVNLPTLVGHWYMPAESALLVERYLQPGLAGNPLHTLVMGIGNEMNKFNLGMSAYHALGTTLNAQMNAMELAIRQVLVGDFGGSIPNAIKGVIPFSAVVHDFIAGTKLSREWFSPGSQGAEMGAMLEMFQQAGGRAQMGSEYQFNAIESFRKAIRTQAGALPILGHGLRAASEALSYPIMGLLVPRVKMGAFVQRARAVLDNLGPKATLDERRAALYREWQSIENRMGQVTYPNLMWNRVLRDILHATVRSVGWNAGDIGEAGGAVRDIPSSLKAGMKGKMISPRLAYMIALPIVAGLNGALLHWLMKGKPPEDAKDCFYPRTGGIRPDGSEDRVSLPTYVKDFSNLTQHMETKEKAVNPFQWGENAYHAASGKKAPFITNMGEMLSNKDFFDKPIRNPDDPLTKQAVAELRHFLGGWEPMSVEAATKQQGSPGMKALGFAGITPAPSYVTRGPGGAVVEDYYDQLKRSQDAHQQFTRQTQRGMKPDYKPEDMAKYQRLQAYEHVMAELNKAMRSTRDDAERAKLRQTEEKVAKEALGR